MLHSHLNKHSSSCRAKSSLPPTEEIFGNKHRTASKNAPPLNFKLLLEERLIECIEGR